MSLENQLLFAAFILACLLTLFLSYKRKEVFNSYHKGVFKYKVKIYVFLILLMTLLIYILMLIIAGIHWIILSIFLANIVGLYFYILKLLKD